MSVFLNSRNERVKATRISGAAARLSDRAEQIYSTLDGEELFRGYGFQEERIFLADRENNIIAEGLEEIESYLLSLEEC